MSPPISILVVDDHPLLREGLAALVQSQPDMVVVGEAENGSAALQAYRQYRPGVVLLDMRLPDMKGTDVIRRIRGDSAAARVIVITNYQGDLDIQQALTAGASGYLFKTSARADVLSAIRAVHSGATYISAAVAASLSRTFSHVDLSPRETQVLELMANGSRNKEIAGVLGISELTVKEHVSRILQKLGVGDRTAAISVALQRGLLHLD